MYTEIYTKGCRPSPRVLSNSLPPCGGGRDKPGAPPCQGRVSTLAISYQHIAISTINKFCLVDWLAGSFFTPRIKLSLHT